MADPFPSRQGKVWCRAKGSGAVQRLLPNRDHFAVDTSRSKTRTRTAVYPQLGTGEISYGALCFILGRLI